MTELPTTAPGNAALDATLVTCPNCGGTNAATARFCEECGKPLSLDGPAAGAPVDGTAADGTRLGGSGPDGTSVDGARPAAAPELESPITLSSRQESPKQAGVPPEASALETDLPDNEDTVVIARPCANCGGVIGEDGYCQTCGTKAPTERDHYTEQPSSWVAACCDKGIRHFRNEDATAVASDPNPGGRAVLVVCDGVSTSVDSDIASLAAARAAREVLLAHRPAGMGVPASRTAATASALQAAASSANAAVVEVTAPGSESAASCTFAAAVIDGGQIVFGNVGDSRVYWLPDAHTGAQPAELSLDDSVAQARIAMGVSREEAENGPQAHAITKWLGRDSPDIVPRTGSIEASHPGWLLVCSDGLWNYVSEAAAMQSLVATLSGANPDPLPLSVSLVGWANEQGGKDNISVALARYQP
jgi:serine/threonine protein phosphatase PrpC